MLFSPVTLPTLFRGFVTEFPNLIYEPFLFKQAQARKAAVVTTSVNKVLQSTVPYVVLFPEPYYGGTFRAVSTASLNIQEPHLL